MKERLQVKNFGPLKDIDMELKDFMVLIGPQGVGKSAIAKLILIKNETQGMSDELLTASLLNYKLNWAEAETEISINNKSLVDVEDNESVIMSRYFLNNDIQDLLKGKEKVEIFLKSNRNYYIINENQDFSGLLEDLAEKRFITENERHLSSQSKKSILFLLENIRVVIENNLHEFSKGGRQVNKKQAEILLDILEKAISLLELYKRVYKIDPHYIPAERGFLPSISGLTLNLIQNKVPLAPGIIDFGATFERARIAIPLYENPLLDVTYKFEGGMDRVYLKDGTALNLKDTASGYQTIIPLMLVVEYLTQDKDLSPHYFIIEEPELNLYPSTQKALVEWLVKKCKESGSKLLMTTHSPYILTAMDNLIKAGEVAKQKPEEEKAISKIVKKDYWLDFDNVGVYYINKGKAKNLMNKTNRTINATAIDDVSEEMGVTFDKLLSIQYPDKWVAAIRLKQYLNARINAWPTQPWRLKMARPFA